MDEAGGIGMTEVGCMTEHDVRLPEGNGGAVVGEIGILLAEIRRGTGDEQTLGIVVKVRATRVL